MPIHPLNFGAVQGSSTRVSSPLATSFGFGTAVAGPLTPSTASPYPHQWTSPHHHPTNGHSNPFAHAFARTESHSVPNRGQVGQHEGMTPTTSTHAKRRRSPSDDEAMMERGSVSPTPAGRTMKRLRQGREAIPSESTEEHGNSGQADLGVLLASLPSSTHLQILHSLIASHPELKPVIHALIPAPEVGFAIQVLDEKLERLVEAVPIGAHSVGSTSSAASRPVGASFGFGSRAAPTANGTVSDGYIVNRLRMPLTEFTNVALTYLPYFTPQTTKPPSPPIHPSTSFRYLSHVTTLIITRIIPLIPTSAHPSPTLAPLDTLLHALQDAWDTWLANISQHVNADAGMYPASTAENWITTLESLASQAERLTTRRKPSTGTTTNTLTSAAGKPPSPPTAVDNLAHGLRQLAREWVRQVGWLIGRNGDEGMGDRMDE